MDHKKFVEVISKTIGLVGHPRYFETERGFQGALNAQLARTLEGLIPQDFIIEEEYQKRLKPHGITIRPDIIIHTPFQEQTHKSTAEGNFAVFQIKLKASTKDSMDDFEKLDMMFEKLNYPIGIFINISSRETHYKNYKGKFPDRLHCFAVELDSAGKVSIYHN